MANFTSVAETLAHPAYPTVLWNLEPHSRGRLAVAKDRDGPVAIGWQIHGEGPIKVIFIPGLASTHHGWQRQIKHFGHDHGGRFTILSLDNRGIGASDKPLGRYTTSNMALDVLEVADHVGWTGPREIHLVGISMGGMIAQEIAAHAPTRLASLSLVATAAAVEDTQAWHQVIGKRVSMLMPKTVERTISDTARQIFTPAWLAAPDSEALPLPGSTPRCAPPAGSPGGEYKLFATNFQRFQALELSKRRDPKTWSTSGFMCQLLAAAGHSKNERELRAMADQVGRHRIAVVHGTLDEMFHVSLAEKLIGWVEPAEAHVMDGMGHAPVYENVEWFNQWLQAWLEKCHVIEAHESR